jgi:hypothetical protein
MRFKICFYSFLILYSLSIQLLTYADEVALTSNILWEVIDGGLICSTIPDYQKENETSDKGRAYSACAEDQTSCNNDPCKELDGYRELNERQIQVFPKNSGVTHVIAKPSYRCIVKNQGVFCWGDDKDQAFFPSPKSLLQIFAPGAGVTDIALTKQFACVVINGGVSCWGSSGVIEPLYGSFPVDPKMDPRMKIQKMTVRNFGITDIAVTEKDICAVRYGEVTCFGKNLGKKYTNADHFDISDLPRLASNEGCRVTKIAAANNCFCFVELEGIFCFGDCFGKTYRVKKSNLVVLQLEKTDKVTYLTMGWNFGCVVKNQGLYCWGINNRNQINDSDGDVVQRKQFSFSRNELFPTLSGFSYIAADKAICARVYGKSLCWGYLVSDNEVRTPDEVRAAIVLSAEDRTSVESSLAAKQYSLDQKVLGFEVKFVALDAQNLFICAQEEMFRSVREELSARKNAEEDPRNSDLMKKQRLAGSATAYAKIRAEKASTKAQLAREIAQTYSIQSQFENSLVELERVHKEEIDIYRALLDTCNPVEMTNLESSED